MAHSESRKSEKPFLNTTLEKVLDKGTRILNRQPDFLENFSHASGRWLKNVDLSRSHGIYIATKEGMYLDFANHWNTGLLDRLKHPELNDPEYLKLLGILAQEKATPTETGSGVEAAFVDMMQGFFAKGIEEDKKNFQVLPVSAGTLAVDDAIYTARGLVAENRNVSPQSLKGLAFEGAFHGRHGEAADATANKAKVGHKDRGYVTHVKAPVVQFDPSGRIIDAQTDKNLKDSVWAVEKRLFLSNYAYVITEYPIQAEGGARILHKDTLRFLHDICKEYGKVLIVDAVQMGGRSWYENKETGVVAPFANEVIEYADIIAFGKVFHANGSVLNNKNIAKKGLNPNYIIQHPQEHGGTYTSTFADMLSGLMIMSVILKKKLWVNALGTTGYIYGFLTGLSESFPEGIQCPRVREDTAYIAWDLPTRELRDRFIKLMVENEHKILLHAGETSIRLAPNPDMTHDEMLQLCYSIKNQLYSLYG